MDDLSTLPDIWAAPISQGWSVFPLEARGKKPLCEWKKFQVAPASLEQVREWTKRECNIGIVTGRISKIVVLDLDNDEAIAEAKRLGLPHTPTVRTGRGRHVYFRHPGSFDVPNAAGIFPGADIRGDGGYVVGPGSVHENGKIYTWALPPGLHDFAPLPEWMLDRLRPGIARVQADRIRNAPPGTRNDTLNRVSFETARMAVHGEVDGPDARRRLAEAAMDAGLDRHEILPTLKSGWTAGTAAEIAKGSSARPHPKPPPRFEWVSGSIIPVLSGNWIIKGLLPKEGMGVVYGRPGCGKSLVVLDISLRTAAGMAWRGLKTKPCPVSYIASEGGGAFANRVVSWCAEYGAPCPPGFRFSTAMLNLRSDETDALALIQDVQIHQPGCGLVIIDTLSRNIAGGNENAAEDMGAFVNLCDRIFERTPLPCADRSSYRKGRSTWCTRPYSPGVKANVIFFEKKEGRAAAWTDKLWVYDLRTNQHFTLKQKPIRRSDFDEFIACYKLGSMHERKETWSEANPEGRWRCFDYDELLKRDKLSLDLFWIKDKSLTDTDALPAPEIIAAEIADDLEAALEQFTKIAARLGPAGAREREAAE